MSPTDGPQSPARAPRLSAALRRAVATFGVREIGIGTLALAALLAAAGVRQHAPARDREVAALRREMAPRVATAEAYRERLAALQTETADARSWAVAQPDEALRGWGYERMRRLEALVAAVNQAPAAETFFAAVHQVEEQLRAGNLSAARARVDALPAPPRLPLAEEMAALRRHVYEEPLAQFSRANPTSYRALRQFEPEAAGRDAAALRAEVAAASAQPLTPAVLLKRELLAAVSGASDPLTADGVVPAIDYFEAPDPATLLRWQRVQGALKRQDWGAASAEMANILHDKVRVRQPFRTAFGRALLRNDPDAVGAHYEYIAEAAAAGDRAARRAVVQADLRAGRRGSAEQWLERAVADGDLTAFPELLQLYRAAPGMLRDDAARRAALLERVIAGGNAPAEAWLALGQLYEQAAVPGASTRRAFECFRAAAAKGSAEANAAVARCALHGIGTAADDDHALDAAIAAFQGGASEEAAAILGELLGKFPDRTVAAVLPLFSTETVAVPGGYTETRVVDGPGVAALRVAVARYLDQRGDRRGAARLYAKGGTPEARQRYSELTTIHRCETCGGAGKVCASAVCPTCGGKGTQRCSFCGGAGRVNVPGTPKCPACGGAGQIMQNRRLVTCATCGGSGNGRGSVVRRPCEHCDGGTVACPNCSRGTITVLRECPDCHGAGSWSLADRAAER